MTRNNTVLIDYLFVKAFEQLSARTQNSCIHDDINHRRFFDNDWLKNGLRQKTPFQYREGH